MSATTHARQRQKWEERERNYKWQCNCTHYRKLQQPQYLLEEIPLIKALRHKPIPHLNHNARVPAKLCILQCRLSTFTLVEYKAYMYDQNLKSKVCFKPAKWQTFDSTEAEGCFFRKHLLSQLFYLLSYGFFTCSLIHQFLQNWVEETYNYVNTYIWFG
jgi:hypothetical protein